MNKTARAIFVALFGSVASLALVANTAPAFAAAPIKIENKALADAVSEMNNLEKAGNLAGALAKAKEVDAIPGKPAELTRQIHTKIMALAIAAKDYPSALTQIDKSIAAKEGDPKQLMGQALAISIQSGNKEKQAEYAAKLGNEIPAETRLFIADGMRKSKQYKEALAEVQPLMQVEKPTENTLRFVVATNFEMGDTVGRRAALEQLVLYYGKPQDWHDLFQLARNEKGLSDEGALDIYRLRLLVGDLKTDTEYLEMAQQALITNYPNEAKAILDKGTAAKLLSGERVARMNKMASDNVSKDGTQQQELKAKSATDPNAHVKLGLIYWTYGKNKEAEDEIRAGMMGKLADPEAAKVALGHVLLAEGKKPDAANAFGSVTRNSKSSSVARLWSIYARRG
jgi:hypothetical protein